MKIRPLALALFAFALAGCGNYDGPGTYDITTTYQFFNGHEWEAYIDVQSGYFKSRTAAVAAYQEITDFTCKKIACQNVHVEAELVVERKDGLH